MNESFHNNPVVDGVVEGSPAAKAMEAMGKIPALMQELVQLSMEKKSLEALDRDSLPPKTQTYLAHIQEEYAGKKAEMEGLITTLEENGQGFTVQGAREQLSLLD
ncbi:MAG: hypothetical protein RL292_576 [Candidatus Parcubacteria bacterium]|jgi:hypothetical protein